MREPFFPKDKSPGQLLLENREYIAPVLFYLSGLFIGTFLYHADSPLSALLEKFGALNDSPLLTLFINRFALYIAVYALTVLLGMCLIGFPFINLVPLFTGVAVALRASYFYVAYPVKGIGYTLLMLAPESAAFVTVLVFAIQKSRALSRSIFALTVKKEDMPGSFALSAYLKSFALYIPVIAFIALVNAAAVYLLGAIVKI